MKNRKKNIFLILLIIWLCVIFFFSNQSGELSIKQSDTLIYKITDIVSTKDVKEKESISTKWTFYVRKTAHFLEYFVLGLIIYIVLDLRKVKYILTNAIIFSILCASLDEIHQLFVIGRTAKILDVIIDTIGSSLAIIVANFIKKSK